MTTIPIAPAGATLVFDSTGVNFNPTLLSVEYDAGERAINQVATLAVGTFKDSFPEGSVTPGKITCEYVVEALKLKQQTIDVIDAGTSLIVLTLASGDILTSPAIPAELSLQVSDGILTGNMTFELTRDDTLTPAVPTWS